MRRNSETPHAIVVGSGLNALGVIRSLGSGGIRVAAISRTPSDPPQRSRYTQVRRQAPNAGPELIDAIESVSGHKSGPVVLFFTEEDSVQYLAEHRVTLPSNVICRLPAPDVLLALLNKSRFDQLCHDHGFDVPKSFSLASGGTLNLPGSLRYPLIVKPAVKTPDYGARFKKAYIVESADDARCTAESIAEAVGHAIIQVRDFL